MAFGVYCLVISPLFISYNALSHDVFNYIFNARMVVEYQANPHLQVALDFSSDPWTRFMHNTHTPAPYWYGWTALSVVPYGLGFEVFSITWLNFRIFSLLSLFLLWATLWLWQKQRNQPVLAWQFALFFLNPLVLIEIVSNNHNDLWMIVPALLAFVLLQQKPKYPWQTILSFALLLFSASTKYATLILMPIWLIAYKLVSFTQISASQTHGLTAVVSQIKKRFESILSIQIQIYVEKLLPWVTSILLFIPLLTSRSRWFLPWYLVWSFSLVPLLASNIWITDLPKISIPILTSLKKRASIWGKRWVFWLLALSVSSLFRYLPWIWQGEYNNTITTQEILITWLGGGMLFAVFCFIDHLRAKKSVS